MNRAFTQAKAAASKALKSYGVAVTVTSSSGSTLKGYGVLLNSTSEEEKEGKVILFQGSDKDPSPAPGDLASFKGENWGIVSVEDINPDGSLTILFKLTVAQ